jgi:hypothetical protein
VVGDFALFGFCFGLAVYGIFLLVAEVRRYRSDPSPAPPARLDRAALEPWHRAVVVLIAGLAIASALLAWRSSTSFGSASGLDSQVLRDTALYQGELGLQDGRIDFGAHLSLLEQEHHMAATQLLNLADKYQTNGNTNLANQLEANAHVEAAQARVFDNGYLRYSGTSNADGTVTYDRAQQEKIAVASDDALRTLGDQHAAELRHLASIDRTRAQQIALTTALFVAAMFFLTVANLGWRHRRLHALVPALLFALLGIVVLATAFIA